MSSVNVNLHGHYINFVNLHIFNLTNMNNFETYKYIKLIIFFKILHWVMQMILALRITFK